MSILLTLKFNSFNFRAIIIPALFLMTYCYQKLILNSTKEQKNVLSIIEFSLRNNRASKIEDSQHFVDVIFRCLVKRVSSKP